MTLTLDLPTELEKQLSQEAKRNGLGPGEYALHVLQKELAPAEFQRRKDLVALVQSWIDDPDPAEQIETREYLIRALDEDRLSDRKLFPAELKGKTW